MKKYALTFVFMLLAFLVLTGNVQAKTSVLNYATPFELNDFQQNLFSNESQRRYSLTITNRSAWVIDEVYVETSENQEEWGKDMLGRDRLGENEYFTISNLIPGEYDVKFVDEEGDECILRNIAIFQNKSWAITTKWLESCEGYH
jgi:hypothetical protein